MKYSVYYLLAFFACLLTGITGLAQSPLAVDSVDSESTLVDKLNAGGLISIIQPEGLNQRLLNQGVDGEDNRPGQNSTVPNRRSGYRVQIYDSNAQGARDEAQRRKAAVESRMGVNAYVRFESPYWRVRVGDYRTRGEAEHALIALKRMFPGYAASFRVVRDHIRPAAE